MASVAAYGVHPDNSPASNRDRIVYALNDLAKPKRGSRGGVLYFPPGRYITKPINKAMLNKYDTRYVSLVGDGIKASILELAPGETEPLWDWDGLSCFDVSIEKMAFYGNRSFLPFVMRLNSGGRHYRISMRDVEFRYNGGDGLVMSGGQLASLDRVTCQRLGGWGLRVDGFSSIYASSLDVEVCDKGGVLFALDGDGRRDLVHAVINNLYVENCNPGVRISGVGGVQINEPTPCVIEFTDGAFGNTVTSSYVTADFQQAHNNYVTGYPLRQGSPRLVGMGRDVALNYVGTPGGGMPCEVPITDEFVRLHSLRTLYPKTNDTERYFKWLDTTPGLEYNLLFTAREIVHSNPLIAVAIQNNAGNDWRFWNVMKREWSSVSTSFSVGIGRELKRFSVPFTAESSRTGAALMLGISKSHIDLHELEVRLA